MRTGILFQLSPEDRARLDRLVADRNTRQKHVRRAQIVLLTAEGVGTMEIMERTGQSKPTVWRWQARFAEAGVDGLLRDKTRPPGKKPLSEATVRQVVTKTTTERPPDATHWSARAMARAVGIAVSSVQKIWQAHGLKPHQVRTFKLSNDPDFEAKLVDVVGLYLNPPDRALVLSVDEKSQIQALDRTQPGLPLTKGRAGTLTHDYKRHGTTTLFAALNLLDGRVIGRCMDKHRHQEFIRFLDTIDADTPADIDLHLIVDNYGTHKHAEVAAWLERHPRFHLHFTPTASSWLNMVEWFFAEITRKRIRRGVFRSVTDLEVAIYRYLAEHNEHPKPFVWTATTKEILAKVEKAKTALRQTIGTKR
ncbi:transposase (plasmid) [Azospirillum sp. B510]|uniref:IS630-like element ISAzs31 family transposase n=1 Tax=Azospirillum sp. (strain B510) TaxID=137722 RepID=UPI0001C4C737|nr:IS630-like element ISAzs31 family transposase [Azospirillum sp. B510]BAI75059.1 transposase [Azospirillum sp. B510]